MGCARLDRRGRIDWLLPNAIVDLKTTINAAPSKFSRALIDYGYALQAAWYQEGYEALTGERLPFVKTPFQLYRYLTRGA